MSETHVTGVLGTPLAPDRPGSAWPTRFFAGIGVLCIVLVVAGFGRNVYRGLTGAIVIPFVHVHAAVMSAWLVVYLLQAAFAARGDLARHRRLGRAAVWLAGAVWISMAVATINALQRYDPDAFTFLVKPLLTQLGLMAVFAIFVIWGLAVRRHADWHKRLMTFATFSLVQAGLDRMDWFLPNEGLPMFWHYGIRAYVVLFLPLFVYDLVTLRRVHPATLAGTALMIAMHAVVTFYWSHEGWNQVARGFWMWVR